MRKNGNHAGTTTQPIRRSKRLAQGEQPTLGEDIGSVYPSYAGDSVSSKNPLRKMTSSELNQMQHTSASSGKQGGIAMPLATQKEEMAPPPRKNPHKRGTKGKKKQPSTHGGSTVTQTPASSSSTAVKRVKSPTMVELDQEFGHLSTQIDTVLTLQSPHHHHHRRRHHQQHHDEDTPQSDTHLAPKHTMDDNDDESNTLDDPLPLPIMESPPLLRRRQLFQTRRLFPPAPSSSSSSSSLAPFSSTSSSTPISLPYGDASSTFSFSSQPIVLYPPSSAVLAGASISHGVGLSTSGSGNTTAPLAPAEPTSSSTSPPSSPRGVSRQYQDQRRYGGRQWDGRTAITPQHQARGGAMKSPDSTHSAPSIPRRQWGSSHQQQQQQHPAIPSTRVLEHGNVRKLAELRRQERQRLDQLQPQQQQQQQQPQESAMTQQDGTDRPPPASFRSQRGAHHATIITTQPQSLAATMTGDGDTSHGSEPGTMGMIGIPHPSRLLIQYRIQNREMALEVNSLLSQLKLARRRAETLRMTSHAQMVLIQQLQQEQQDYIQQQQQQPSRGQKRRSLSAATGKATTTTATTTHLLTSIHDSEPYQRLVAQYREAEHTIDSIQIELDKQTKEAQQYERELAKVITQYEQQQRVAQELTATLHRLQTQYEGEYDAQRSLARRVDTLTQMKDGYQSTITTLEGKIASLEQQLVVSTQTVASHTKKIESLTTTLATCKANHAKERANKEEMVQTLTNNHQSVQQDYTALQYEHAQLVATHTTAKQHTQHLQQQYDQLKTDHNALVQDIAELRKAYHSSQSATSQQAVEQSAKELEMQQVITQQQQRIASLEQDATYGGEQVRLLTRELSEVTQQCASEKAAHAQTQDMLTTLTTTHTTECAHLQRQYADTQGQLASLKASSAQQLERIHHLEQRLQDSITTHQQTLAADRQTHTDAYEQLEHDMILLAEQLQQSQDREQFTEVVIQEAHQAINEWSHHAEYLEQELFELRRAMRQAEQDFADNDTALRRVLMECKVALQQYRALTRGMYVDTGGGGGDRSSDESDEHDDENDDDDDDDDSRTTDDQTEDEPPGNPRQTRGNPQQSASRQRHDPSRSSHAQQRQSTRAEPSPASSHSSQPRSLLDSSSGVSHYSGDVSEAGESDSDDASLRQSIGTASKPSARRRQQPLSVSQRKQLAYVSLHASIGPSTSTHRNVMGDANSGDTSDTEEDDF